MSTGSRPPMESDNTVPFEGDTSGPFGQAALQAAWDKLYRARALLEAEQSHLRDDRIELQADLEALELREQSVAAREMRVQQLEIQAALEKIDAEEAKETLDAKQAKGSNSPIARLTKAPFDMARSVFGQKK